MEGEGERWQEKSGHLDPEHAGMLTSGYHSAGHCVKGKTVFLLPQRERSGEGGGRYYLHSEVKTCSVGRCLDKALRRLDHSRRRHFSIFFI